MTPAMNPGVLDHVVATCFDIDIDFAVIYVVSRTC